jgi:hypothetical protein
VCHPSRLGEGHHGGTGSDDAGNHPEFGWLTRVVRNPLRLDLKATIAGL